MIRKRFLLLSFLAAGVLRSPVLLSDSAAIAVSHSVTAATVHVDAVDNAEAIESFLNHHAGPLADVIVHSPEPEQQQAELADSADAGLVRPEQQEALRQLFLQAEQAVEQRDASAYRKLAAQLQGYPLYPYLQYQWLKQNLDDEQQVKRFLQQHHTSYFAGLLKGKWLYHLARNKNWNTFLQYYRDDGDARLQCYFRRAQFHTGKRDKALAGAADLWAVGKSQPKVCDPLFAQLKKSSLFTTVLFWKRFQAAMQNHNIRLAKYVKKLMPPSQQRTASLWLKLHRNPARYLPELLKHDDIAPAPAMFTHAIKRLASRDVQRAVEWWDANRQRFALTEKQCNTTETRLALKLAYENSLDAYQRLGDLPDANYHSKTWRIRVALAEQDWLRVIEAINALSDVQKRQEKWQYWLARAYEETGKDALADSLYSGLSVKRDFYAYLAADKLGRHYQLADRPLDILPQQIEAVQKLEGMQAVRELLALDREELARQQWWHVIRQLDHSHVPVAAKLAQQWRWHDVAIFTIARVKYWDDVELRFPLGYSDEIHKHALIHDLDPAILFGITRRESAFNKVARSPVGARGLMQLMPKTARYVARQMGERWHGVKDLLEPDNNLKYGAWYYQYLLKKFDGNYAAALAAYNAGPHRVKKWLPKESLPADIWIETIPLRETRDYVTSVLVYAMIYKQRLQSGELSLSDFTADVEPLTELAAN